MADRVIVINPDQQAREQLVEDMKRLKENPLNESKVPGGVFGNAGGDGFHNAHGQAVDEDGNVLGADDAPAPKAAAKKGK